MSPILPGGMRRRSRKAPKLRDDLAADEVEGVRIGQLAHGDDDVLGAGVGQVAEALDDLGSASRCRGEPSGEIVDVLEGRVLDLVAGRGRPRRNARPGSRTCGRCPRATRRRCVASAYWATSRRVFFSPPPPIMIGTLGRDSDCGELSSRVGLEQPAVGCSPSAAALALPHPVGDLERLLEHLETDAERREREPERRATPPRSRRPRCRARPGRPTGRRASWRP